MKNKLNKISQFDVEPFLWFVALILFAYSVKCENCHNINQSKEELNVNQKVEIQEVTVSKPIEIVEEEIEEPCVLKSLGIFTASAYCNEDYAHICNDGTPEDTATGTAPTEGRTVAVDPEVIPLGSTIVINGNEFIAEDTGHNIIGKKVDICFNSHEYAKEFGIREVEVFIKG